MNWRIRIPLAIIWVALVSSMAEISYNTSVATDVWIYSNFVFLFVSAIFGAAVILFLQYK